MLPFFTSILILKILDFTYLTQVKEYRLDRFIVSIEDVGFGHLLFKRSPQAPAKSVRNLLIVGLSLILCAILTIYLYLHYPTTLTQILLLLMSPFIALCFVWFGVLVTWPLAHIKRTSIVKKAQMRIAQSQAIRIGISGTYGKSSVKEMLYHILSARYETAKTDKNMNTPVGVAISILTNLKNSTRYFVGEVGGYKRGEVADATQVLNPQHAILTPFGNQHLALYGSRDNLIKTESEIVEYLAPDSLVYIPYESKPLLTHLHHDFKTYSLNHKDATIYASDITVSSKGTQADIHNGKTRFTIKTSLLGKHTIQNLLPCIGIAMDLGMTAEEVKKSISSMGQISGKLSTQKGRGESTIINDTGNSSLEGFLAAIETLNGYKKAKKIIVSKGIIELGKEKNNSYKTIINQINKYNINLYTDDKLFKKYDQSNNVIMRYNTNDLLNAIKTLLDKNTVLLLEGRFSSKFTKQLLD